MQHSALFPKVCHHAVMHGKMDECEHSYIQSVSSLFPPRPKRCTPINNLLHEKHICHVKQCPTTNVPSKTMTVRVCWKNEVRCCDFKSCT